ncbi:MAG: diacylglycerol kinase [Xanthomonadales bacterium]|nr:diacylglycerol kinase [Xanthomonadales bacterium]
MKPGKTGVSRLRDAASYSMSGIRACWRNEAAFRQDAALAAVLMPISFVLAQTIEQWLLLVFPLFLLLVVELLNTAIENTVDRIGSEFNPLSAKAKDMGSAAVFFCLLLTGLCWVSIAWKNAF